MKVKESLNVTFDESPPLTKLSPLVDDDVGEEDAIRKNTKIVNTNNDVDESIEVEEIVNIKESKNHPLDQVKSLHKVIKWTKRTQDYLPRVHRSRQMDEELRDSYRTLEKRLFHEGRIITPSFIAINDMLPFFQAIAITLPPNMIVKKAITTPRTTQAQLLRDLNKLYIDDIRPDLKGWELFFKENLFCSINKINKSAATATIISVVCQANDHGFGRIRVPKQKRNMGTKEIEHSTLFWRFVKVVHCVSGLSFLKAVCLIRQRFVSSGLSSSVAVY
nr:hypothetical protein [Tanacetum cinerariifolium]